MWDFSIQFPAPPPEIVDCLCGCMVGCFHIQARCHVLYEMPGEGCLANIFTLSADSVQDLSFCFGPQWSFMVQE